MENDKVKELAQDLSEKIGKIAPDFKAVLDTMTGTLPKDHQKVVDEQFKKEMDGLKRNAEELRNRLNNG